MFLVETSLLKKLWKVTFPFFTTHHPYVKELAKLIGDLLLFIYSNQEVKKVFSPPLMLSYRSARNKKDYIVRSKLQPDEGNVGCQGYANSRCKFCKSANITDEFPRFATEKKTYKINHSFDCNDKCLIYLLSCKTCCKQYIGNTIVHFRTRWNNYKSDVNRKRWHRKRETKVIANTSNKVITKVINHILKDVEPRLTDKAQASDPTNREFYWMITLRTFYPDGFNIESDY